MKYDIFDVFVTTLGEFLSPNISTELFTLDEFIGIANFGLFLYTIFLGLAINNQLNINIPKILLFIVFGGFGMITGVLLPPELIITLFISYSTVFRIISGGIVGFQAFSNPYLFVAILFAIVIFTLVSFFDIILPEVLNSLIALFLIIFSIKSIFLISLTHFAENKHFAIGIAVIICVGTFAPLADIINDNRFKIVIGEKIIKNSFFVGILLGALLSKASKIKN